LCNVYALALRVACPRERSRQVLIQDPAETTRDLVDVTSVLNAVPGADQGLSRLHVAYYAVKPLVPRRLQLTARRLYALIQRRRAARTWPIEPLTIERQHAALEHEVARHGPDGAPFLSFWPDRKRFAYVLTHDVEGPAGLAAIEPILELEQRYSVRSAWYLVSDDYAVPEAVLERLRAAGCEVGLHGLHHDGSLFRNRASFQAALPQIRDTMRGWGALGFRSPATHRKAAWMPELGCLYDSSFPDADPFEPQSGGCYSILPFCLGDLVELPITLPQDHTLYEILRWPAVPTWTGKADWIAEHHGLVNPVVHPDYMCTPERLTDYEDLLRHLTAREDGWHALPREVATWWRVRAAIQRGDPPVEGDLDDVAYRTRASVARARREGNEIVIDL
jgi:peptidoglycan/xylan/chitin deacetylase (PgdA/CDA1 family)